MPEGECVLYTNSLSVYVLIIIASVCGLWASVIDFKELDEAIILSF